jgi:uncharacterized membrane protein
MRRISLPPRDDGAIEGRVTIQRSIDDVFRFYRGFRNLPRFLGDVTAIEPLGRATYRWTIQGPLGVRVKWKVKMTMDKNFKRTFATAAWITQSEGTVAWWGVPRGPSVS